MLGWSRRWSTSWTRRGSGNKLEDSDRLREDENHPDQTKELCRKEVQRYEVSSKRLYTTQSFTSGRRRPIWTEEREAFAIIHWTFRDSRVGKRSLLQTCITTKDVKSAQYFSFSMLRKWAHYSNHKINLEDIKISDNIMYNERPFKVLDHGVKKLRSKEKPLVKI